MSAEQLLTSAVTTLAVVVVTLWRVQVVNHNECIKDKERLQQQIKEQWNHIFKLTVAVQKEHPGLSLPTEHRDGLCSGD